MELRSTNLISNTANGGSPNGNGGGLYNVSGTVTLTSSTVIYNAAVFGGGGIYNNTSATLTVINSTLSGNSAGQGGGIYNLGTVTVTNSTLTNNTGGGIANVGTGTVTSSSISNNTAIRNGAGIPHGGGGIYNFGTLSVTDSTLSGNAATGYFGGGIYSSQGTVSVTNSTLSGNTATYGGGLYNDAGGRLTLTNSTVSGNAAGTKGGGLYSTGTLTLRGTLVANNTSGGDCGFSVTLSDSGYNLDSDGSCGLTQPTDITNTNPLLGPLANNGGPTPTMALLAGSPAIDTGGTSATGCPATDQRGMPRPDAADGPQGQCDIGAYESQGVGVQ
jgi:predicted outer membrane repeat protein